MKVIIGSACVPNDDTTRMSRYCLLVRGKEVPAVWGTLSYRRR